MSDDQHAEGGEPDGYIGCLHADLGVDGQPIIQHMPTFRVESSTARWILATCMTQATGGDFHQEMWPITWEESLE